MKYPKETFYNNNKRHDEQYNKKFLDFMEKTNHIAVGMELDYFFNQILFFIENNSEGSKHFKSININIYEDDRTGIMLSYCESLTLSEKDNLDSFVNSNNWQKELNKSICRLSSTACSYLASYHCLPNNTEIIEVPFIKDIKKVEQLLLSYLPEEYNIHKQKYMLEEQIDIKIKKNNKTRHL